MIFSRRRKQQKKPSVSTASPEVQTRPLPRNPKLQREQVAHDLKHLLIQGEGLRYFARIIALSGALAPSYSSSGAEATAYNEGLRRMGLFILAEVQEHAPELLPRLLLLCLPVQNPVQ